MPRPFPLSCPKRASAQIIVSLLVCLGCVQILGQSASVSVKLLDAIDSDTGRQGQTYRAVVAQPANVFGTPIPKETPAIVVLEPGTGDYQWTLKLAALDTDQVLLANGHSPTVASNIAGILGSLNKTLIATKSRIAAAAGVTLRFAIDGPLVPAGHGNAAPGPLASNDLARAQQPAAASTPLPGPPPEEGTQIGGPGTVLQANGLEVRLAGCARHEGASTTCDFVVTNHADDRELDAGSEFGIVDSKGQTLDMRSTNFAGTSGRATTVSGIATKLQFTYGGSDPDVTSIVRLPLSLRDMDHGTTTFFEWRNVPLQGANVAQAEPSAAPDPMVQVVDGWRLTVMRCTEFPRTDSGKNKLKVVQCFVRVENLKADRDMIVDNAIGVDQNGQQIGNCAVDSLLGCAFDASTGWIGDETDYSHAPKVPLDENHHLIDKHYMAVGGPTVALGKPQYIYAVFAGVDLQVTRLALLKWNLREGGQGGGFARFEVSWHGIPLTPVPQLSAKAKTQIAEASPELALHGTPQEQAIQAANAFWKKTLTTCGDTTYARSIRMTYGGFNPQHPTYNYEAYKGVKIDNKFVAVSPTDKMNGVEWVAGSNLHFTAHRTKQNEPDAEWGPWESMMLPSFVKIVKKNGKVTFNDGDYASILTGPACSEVR